MSEPVREPRSRALLVQLARLGDLVQTLPAIESLSRSRSQPEFALDLLCATTLAPIARLFPHIREVLGWQGAQWKAWAELAADRHHDVCREASVYLDHLGVGTYDVAFNVNQHRRAIYAAHLLASRVVGPGSAGPLAASLPAWASYLQDVAWRRADNRVHLSDAFCGLCGVRPPALVPRMRVPQSQLPAACSSVGKGEGLWIAVAVGAGDPERCMSPLIWARWIETFLEAHSRGQVVLIGTGFESEVAAAIQAQLSPLLLGRVWDSTGRLNLAQLASLLPRCQWLVGADTGPLHLGAALGLRTMGLYFARARVHETGPYGPGHWVWQHEGCGQGMPQDWPVEPSVELLLSGFCPGASPEWSLWESRFDDWGTYYCGPHHSDGAERRRESVWSAIGPVMTV
jgi:ADP-heptose:LPS heptosyltransferase